MVSADSLKDILCQSKLTNTERILICLAVDIDRPKSISEIKQLAIKGGLNEARGWNISTLLRRVRTKAVRTEEGWSLTLPGKQFVEELIKPFIKRPVSKVTTNLRSHLLKISNPQTKAFLEEAIGCCEASFWRAAVVLSWAGAVSVLYDHVVQHKLAEFNAEAVRKDAKWKAAKNGDHLARMKEADFLVVLEGISLIGKNVRKALTQCLDLRNACGHPSSLEIGENAAAAHIEVLILNVFSKYFAKEYSSESQDSFSKIFADWFKPNISS